MLTYENASSDGNVAVFCTQRGSSPTDSYLFTCVSLRAFEFSVSTVYVSGHVGLGAGVVTLTLSLSVTADLGTPWHSGRGELLICRALGALSLGAP